MNVLVLDDVLLDRKMVTSLLVSQEVEVMAFERASELVDAYLAQPGWADGALLDILLQDQDMSGVDAAASLRRVGFTGPVVFLSSSNEYGSQTYDVQASGYLLKPVDGDKVNAAIQVFKREIMQRRSRDSAALVINGSNDAQRLLFGDIVYVEVKRNLLNFHLSNGDICSIRAALKDYSDSMLVDKRFARCHRSFIVNLDYVARITGSMALLLDGSQVPVSKSHNEFKERFIQARLAGA
jgi:DNA-binding LytR/AlgR family response regulator